MYNIKVEAVAITQSGAANYLNGENFNLNGRVLSAADADKGYKGAGNLKAPLVVAICSGKAESRSATTAMKVLSSHIEQIKMSRGDYEGAISRYFDNARRDVSLIANDYAEISASLLYAYDNNVVLAGLGSSRCYRIIDKTVETISAPDELDESEIAAPFYYHIDNINSKNIFLLCSEGLYNYVNEHEIASIIENSISTKQAAQKLLNAASSKGSQKDITLILASAEPEILAAAPITHEDRTAAEYGHDDETMHLPAVGAYNDYDYPAPAEEEGSGDRANKILLVILSILAVCVLIAGGIFFYSEWKERQALGADADVSSSDEELIESTESPTERTTDDETTTEEEGTTEEPTTQETTTDETTTRDRTTTTTTSRTTTTTTSRTTTTTTTAPPTSTSPTTTEPPEPSSNGSTTTTTTTVAPTDNTTTTTTILG